MNNNYSLLDLLTILSVILQMQNYEEEKKSLTNDDIAKHLAKQDTEYLQKILKNQEIIIDYLTKLG